MTSTAARTTADPLAERHWICARRLRERRRALGLTQADVVTRMGDSGAALTNRTLSAMENGRGLDLGRLPDLAVALDCTITYLVGLTADPTRWEPDTPLAGHDPPAAPADNDPPAAPADDSPSDPARAVPTVDLPAAHGNWILGPDPPSWSRPR
jgi:transcriptional regulator with XRE-family HTH domain